MSGKCDILNNIKGISHFKFRNSFFTYEDTKAFLMWGRNETQRAHNDCAPEYVLREHCEEYVSVEHSILTEDGCSLCQRCGTVAIRSCEVCGRIFYDSGNIIKDHVDGVITNMCIECHDKLLESEEEHEAGVSFKPYTTLPSRKMSAWQNFQTAS